MKNTFLNRVSAERRVLSVVNKYFAQKKQLAGLSQAAIDRWITIIEFEQTESIRALLISLADKCQRLSDRSNETFMPIEKEQAEEIEEQLVTLQRVLKRSLS